MATYNEEIEAQFTAASTTIITAAPLDIADDHPLRTTGYSPILPSWCVCVTEPCPCKDQDGPIIWLLDGDIRKRVATTRKNRQGTPLFEYHIAQDAMVITETFVRTEVTALAGTTSRSSPLRRLAHERLVRQASGPPRGIVRQAPGSSYGGQECAGGTKYDVWVESDGAGGTVFYYVAVGSC